MRSSSTTGLTIGKSHREVRPFRSAERECADEVVSEVLSKGRSGLRVGPLLRWPPRRNDRRLLQALHPTGLTDRVRVLAVSVLYPVLTSRKHGLLAVAFA